MQDARDRRRIEEVQRDLGKKERWLVLNKLDLLPADEAERRCKDIVRRLRWKGPVYRISGLARQGTEALCRDVMKRLEELGYQPS